MTDSMTMQEFYQIRVKGHFSPQLAGWFDDLTVTNEPEGGALLSGFILDQAELYGILLKIHNLGLTLLSVNRLEPHPDHASQAGHEEK